MLTQINDIEKLPKTIIIDEQTYYFNIDIDINKLYNNTYWIVCYRRFDGYCPIIIIEGDGQKNINIYGEGTATSLEEAVNMLYEYVMNNPDIKIEE